MEKKQRWGTAHSWAKWMRDEPDQSANRLIWFGVQGSPRSPRLWVYSALVLDMLAFCVYGVCVFTNALWQGLQTLQWPGRWHQGAKWAACKEWVIRQVESTSLTWSGQSSLRTALRKCGWESVGKSSDFFIEDIHLDFWVISILLITSKTLCWPNKTVEGTLNCVSVFLLAGASRVGVIPNSKLRERISWFLESFSQLVSRGAKARQWL